jgi:hypothetical protein
MDLSKAKLVLEDAWVLRSTNSGGVQSRIAEIGRDA